MARREHQCSSNSHIDATMKQRPGAPPNITFQLLCFDDHENVKSHLMSNFMVRDPIFRTLRQIYPNHKGEIESWLDDVLEKSTTTIIAKDSLNEDKIIGVCITDIVKANDNFYDFDKSSHDLLKGYSEKILKAGLEDLSDQWKHIITLIHDLHIFTGNFFTKFGCEAIYDIKMVSIDSDYDNNNILIDMLQRSLALARLLGLKAAKAEASGAVSQAAFKQLEFDTLATLDYDHYEGRFGEGGNIFRNIYQESGGDKCIAFMARSIATFQYS